ncbi:ribose ABC transporter permease protein [Firmicutes bacterium CAG:791]|nr:ribose ABC transporter permease protein [Firmicutes bacterium CAG:791]
MREKWKKISNGKVMNSLGPIGILLAIVAILFATTPSFRSSNNMTQILLSASIYMMLSMGMTFAIIIGGVDLSVGSIVGLVGGVISTMMLRWGLPLGIALLCGVLTGALCGCINGLLVTRLGLIPFIATLGGQWIYRGILKLLNDGATVSLRGHISRDSMNAMSFLGNGKVLGIPVPVYFVAVAAAILTFLLKKTTFGRSVYAVGSNVETARMSGINVQKIKLLVFTLTGAMAGLAGMIMITRMTSAQVNCGEGYEFEGIFAAVVGGVSMAGGEGSVLGAVVGALIVAVLRNGLNLNGVNSFWQQVILGVLIVLVVYVDSLRTKKKYAD